MSNKALIIGGTKGLGYALANVIAAAETETIITGRTPPEQMPPRSRYLAMDLSAPALHWDDVAACACEPGVNHVLWVAGAFLKAPLAETREEASALQVALHVTSLMQFMGRFQRARQPGNAPYHLTIVASTSAFKLRADETVYAATKAAQAAFARQFAAELDRTLPGSSTLLVNPGGMNTGFLLRSGADLSKMMPVERVADLVWNEIENQTEVFVEMNILREADGSPRVVYGTQTPEAPVRRKPVSS